jgi:hypothetical protein
VAAGTLADLTVGVQYQVSRTDWPDASVSDSQTPTKLTITPPTVRMPAGRFSATMLLSSPADDLSPLLTPVTLTLN